MPITAGAALCLACCAAPLLLAAGLIGSGSVLVSTSWLEPLGIALLAGGIGGLFWARARSRRSGCGPGACTSPAGTGGAADTGESAQGCSCTPDTASTR